MIYISILNWCAEQDTIACLDSVLATQGADYRVIVCDNGSPAPSYERIAAWCHARADLVTHEVDEQSARQGIRPSGLAPAAGVREVYLIRSTQNLGYAGGNNVALKFALSDPAAAQVWVLNNDTVVRPDSLAHMVRVMQADTGVGICGSRLVYMDEPDTIQGLGGIYNVWMCTSTHYGEGRPATMSIEAADVTRNIDYVIGASMLVSVRLLRDVGLLSDEYFLYFEEIDFCTRARDAGYRLGVAPESVVFHKEGGATKKKEMSLVSDFFFVKNRILFTWKFFPMRLPLAVLSVALAAALRMKRGETRKSLQAMKVILYFFKGRQALTRYRGPLGAKVGP